MTCNLDTLPNSQVMGVSKSKYCLFARLMASHNESNEVPTLCIGPPIRQPRIVTHATTMPSNTLQRMNVYVIEVACIEYTASKYSHVPSSLEHGNTRLA